MEVKETEDEIRKNTERTALEENQLLILQKDYNKVNQEFRGQKNKAEEYNLKYKQLEQVSEVENK